MNKNKLINNPILFAGILIIIVTVITAQSLLLKGKAVEPDGIEFTHYNNYLIFKHSFFHLIQNKDLYQSYPAEHWDYYKYSPAFSLFMAPLAVLPNTFGLFFWNLLNVLLLFLAFWKLPSTKANSRLFMFGFILIELISSVQNSQSNGLIAGLILIAFVSLENKQLALASLFLVLSVFIKLFGLAALALFIFYPDKLKSAVYTIGWIAFFAILPLLVVSGSQLNFLYHSWFNLLQNDLSVSFGFSVAGCLHKWFGLELKNTILLIGAALFCLPFLKYKFFSDLKFRLFSLSSILIWIVIFNYKAESATFIIAISGVAIWGFSQNLKIENLLLLLAALIFTVLSSTDLFPKSLRDEYIRPYLLKAVPCILIWLKITYDLIRYVPEKKMVQHAPAS